MNKHTYKFNSLISKTIKTHYRNYNKEYQQENSGFLMRYHNSLNKKLSQQEFYH